VITVRTRATVPVRNASWSVAPLTHVITVRTRATVPVRNAKELKKLGIVKVADQETMQRGLTHTTAIHLSIIVRLSRKLCKTRTIFIIYVQPRWVGSSDHSWPSEPRLAQTVQRSKIAVGDRFLSATQRGD
jgi:hypothetical protein